MGASNSEKTLDAILKVIFKIKKFKQEISGVLVEYLVDNVKVGGSAPDLCKSFDTAGKFWWHIKLSRKFRPTRQNFFVIRVLYVRHESAAPGLGSRN
jgi:hypothetical protein